MQIAYEVLGMRKKIQSMPKDEDILQEIESQRARTQKQVRKKTLQVTFSTTEEEDEEEEELKLQVLVQRTIIQGEKQIPMGSTPRVQ